MDKRKQTNRQGPRIPDDAIEHVLRELRSLRDPRLSIEKRGRFCYVMHDGTRLCRLGYRDEKKTWNFAIYKYSTDSYSTPEFFPSRGTVSELVRTALDAYNLL